MAGGMGLNWGGCLVQMFARLFVFPLVALAGLIRGSRTSTPVLHLSLAEDFAAARLLEPEPETAVPYAAVALEAETRAASIGRLSQSQARAIIEQSCAAATDGVYLPTPLGLRISARVLRYRHGLASTGPLESA